MFLKSNSFLPGFMCIAYIWAKHASIMFYFFFFLIWLEWCALNSPFAPLQSVFLLFLPHSGPQEAGVCGCVTWATLLLAASRWVPGRMGEGSRGQEEGLLPDHPACHSAGSSCLHQVSCFFIPRVGRACGHCCSLGASGSLPGSLHPAHHSVSRWDIKVEAQHL